MATDALTPDDPRVEHRFTDVGGGITYHYMLAQPVGKPTATVMLLHGWPDLGMGWRFQVPYLLSLGLRVVVPDMLGYGRTSAPEPAAAYSLKAMSAHMAHLIREVTDDEKTEAGGVILGGHDWGAFLAWRVALYYPERVRAVFCFCIPFTPPQPAVIPLADVVARNPVLGYQQQNASGTAEALASSSPAHLRGFLNAMYGGLTPEGLPGFDPYVGLVEERLLRVGPSPLVATDMMEYYVSEFSRNGLHGPMNWYRTRTINGEDELPLSTSTSTSTSTSSFRFEMPAMLVMAGQDPVLTPDLANGQEQYFPAGLLKSEVIPEASHWILVHCPEASNRYIGEFVRQVLRRA